MPQGLALLGTSIAGRDEHPASCGGRGGAGAVDRDRLTGVPLALLRALRVVAVIKAKDFDDALDIANATDFGLTGGLISNSRAHLEKARREFMVGNPYLNRKITGALVGVQPFGGFKLSGSNAKAGGPDYLRLFMEMKTTTERF